MKLIDKLPYFYGNGYTEPIIEAEQIESDILVEEINETLKQCFISTATWGLDYWEDMLFIPRNNSKSYDERRSVIYSKIRTIRTTTVKVIQELASAFFNTENVTVTEENENYIFHIEFENAYSEFVNDPINTDIVDEALVDYADIGVETIVITFKDVENMIDIYKPAHLNYSFTFKLKDKIQIESNQKSGYSTLPICNVTKVGTWWKMYADGISNKGKVIQAKSYDGYSYLPICGIYKCIIKKRKGHPDIDNPDIDNPDNPDTNNNVVGSAIVGSAIVGEESAKSQIGMFQIGYSQLL